MVIRRTALSLMGRMRTQQGLGIGVQRIFEQIEHVACLDHIAGIQHHHLVADLGHNTQVMGDVQDGGLQFVAQLPDQVGDLGFQGHIQGGGGLVGDQKGRIGLQGRGDHDALAHAA